MYAGQNPEGQAFWRVGRGPNSIGLEPESRHSTISAADHHPLPRDGVEEDGQALFRAAQQLDLEGIVAKRKADQYAPETRWFKIKNPAYTQGKGRWELFQKRT